MVEKAGTGPVDRILAEEELPNDNPVVSVGVGRVTTVSEREESSCRISGIGVVDACCVWCGGAINLILPTGKRLTSLPEREEKARREIVKDITRAKKQLGLHGRQRERSFFKDLWPHIFKHLQETGFKLPEGE